MFLEILQDLQLYLKKGSGTHVFCEFCKIFKNTFFTEHLWTTASVIRTVECGILDIKKIENLTNRIIFSLFKHVH